MNKVFLMLFKCVLKNINFRMVECLKGFVFEKNMLFILVYALEMVNIKIPRIIFLKNATDDSVNANCTLPIFTLRKDTKVTSQALDLKM